MTSRPVNCFDIPLAEQLAVVAASDVFLAPHTGSVVVDQPCGMYFPNWKVHATGWRG
jgi:hypothetical protein